MIHDGPVLYFCVDSSITQKRRGYLSNNTTPERFSIPGAGGIITRECDGVEHILFQERCKPDAPAERGLLEIPAGKIRAFECIYDALRREIKEETGLDVVEILGESAAAVYQHHAYKVVNFTPFSCAQNIEGAYPIMVFVFLCRVRGEMLPSTDEAVNYRWISVRELEDALRNHPEQFYPMHVDTLRKYIASTR